MIERAKDAVLYTDDNQEIIDAVSSWWTNTHGHLHPHIVSAINRQLEQLEHVIFSGFTHSAAEQLAQLLLKRIPYHNRVFLSDNGSTAVEAAIKMALQYWHNRGVAKSRILAFSDAYHGDTFGSMSTSARGVFTAPFHPLLFQVDFIPTPSPGRSDALDAFRSHINEHKGQIAAFIFEPLVLGSAGMLMYEPAQLDELIALCKQEGILVIADEVMTGFGRTGKFLATDYCIHKPDIICLSKGITGGFMALAANTVAEHVYEVFLSDEKSKMLFHGHSYTGNAIGCAAAVASMQLFDEEQTWLNIRAIEQSHQAFAKQLNNFSGAMNVRCMGTILAFDIVTKQQTGYLNAVRDLAYNYFLEHGVLLRPLGNVVYILPPYCITKPQLNKVYEVIENFLKQHNG